VLKLQYIHWNAIKVSLANTLATDIPAVLADIGVPVSLVATIVLTNCLTGTLTVAVLQFVGLAISHI
jgi:hypothetical protein